MRTGAKRKKLPSQLRVTLAVNLVRLLDHHFPESTNKNKTLSKLAKTSLSTVQRIIAAADPDEINKSVGATIDKIDAFAEVFDVSPYQLLVPELDPRNPQVLREPTETEKNLYAKLRVAEDMIAAYEKSVTRAPKRGPKEPGGR